MAFYIAVPSDESYSPHMLEELTYPNNSIISGKLFSTYTIVYNDLYEYDELGEYDIYEIDDVSLYDGDEELGVYENDSSMIYLHDGNSSYGGISSLPNGCHYWTPSFVGYFNNGDQVLTFNTYQTKGSQPTQTYNEWISAGGNSWRIYVNANSQFIEKQISVSSGYTYHFHFYTDSEENYDGIIFSTTHLNSGSISGESGQLQVSGSNSDNYDYICTSNGYVYVYFMTDGSVLEGPDGNSSYEYGSFSYSYSATPQQTTRTITLNITWGTSGSTSVTIPISGSYGSYPSITEPTKDGGTFIGYFSTASGGTQYYAAGSGWYQNIPSNVSTLYAHWYNDIQDTLATTMSVSYSSNGRWVVINGSLKETRDYLDGVYLDEYGSYEHGFALQYDPPDQVRIYIPGTSDADGDTSPGTYNLKFILESSSNTSEGVFGRTEYHYLTVTVTKLDQSVPTVTSPSKVYNGTSLSGGSSGSGYGTLYYRSDPNGGTNYGSATTTAPSRTDAGTTTYIAYWGGNTYYNASSYSSQGSITISKADQPTPTVYGHTDTYGNTVYADVVWDNQYGTLYYQVDTNGGTNYGSATTTRPSRSAVGTTTFRAYFSGDNNHNASPWSSQASLTINDYVDDYDYNGYNYDYWANISIDKKSYLTCSGGSSSVSASAGHTHRYYYHYASGSTSGPYTSNSSDSVTWSITTNGNSRFSKSGNTLYHSDMTTNDTTDTVVVTAVNSSSSSATATDSTSIENPITNYDYNRSNSNYWASIFINNKSNLTCSGGSSSVTANAGHTYTYYYLYCSGYTSGPYYSYISDNVTWSITTNGNSRFSKSSNTLNHSSMGKNSTTDTVVVTAVNSSSSSATATDSTSITNDYTDSWNNPSISTYYYDTIPAKGGTSSPHISVSQSGTRTWCSGSTSGLNNYSFSKSYSMTSGNGFSINTSNGIITASDRGTTTGNDRTSNTATLTVTGAGSKSSTKTATCTQSANTLTLRLATGGLLDNHEIDYNDITQLTVNAIYSSGSNEDVTASASLSVGTSGIVSFGNNSDTLSIYIDDFILPGDGWTRDDRAQDWGYSGWDSYISDVIIDPLYFQSSKFVYTGQTFSYSGGTYYLWEQVAIGDFNYVTVGKKYLLTSTINYNTLYSNSIQNSHINDYCPYVAILDEDFNATYTPDINTDYDDWLIKVEHSH